MRAVIQEEESAHPDLWVLGALVWLKNNSTSPVVTHYAQTTCEMVAASGLVLVGYAETGKTTHLPKIAQGGTPDVRGSVADNRTRLGQRPLLSSTARRCRHWRSAEKF
jgi:hypothetical protein